MRKRVIRGQRGGVECVPEEYFSIIFYFYSSEPRLRFVYSASREKYTSSSFLREILLTLPRFSCISNKLLADSCLVLRPLRTFLLMKTSPFLIQAINLIMHC